MPFWSKKDTTVKDPVCGMDVDPKKTSHTYEHMGKTYYFCSATCQANFVKEPAKYLKPVAQSTGGTPMDMGHHWVSPWFENEVSAPSRHHYL